MRASAKWLLGAFAATGAVVFAGLQLTSLANVNGRADPWRIPLAMAGFGGTVLGISLAIGAIGGFLRRFGVTAKALVFDPRRDYRRARESLEDDPSVLGVYTSVGQVWTALLVCVERLRADDGSQDDRDTAVALNSVLANAVSSAALVITARRYRRALVLVACGALVAAIGAGAFAVAVAQPKEVQAVLPTLVRPPTTVDVAILPTSPERARLQSLVGSDCDLANLTGVVLEQKAVDTFDVAVAATGRCRSAVMTLTGKDAIISIPVASKG